MRIFDADVSGSLHVSGSSNLRGNLSVTGSINATSITGSINYNNLTDVPTLVSGSAQIDITNTTNYTSFSSSIAATDLGQNNRLSSLETASGSIRNDFTIASGSIDSRLDVLEAYSSSQLVPSSSMSFRTLQTDVYVKNSTGAQINKGTVVRIIGAVGDNPLIGVADSSSELTSANVLGITTTDIPHDSFGLVITEGVLLSVNTLGMTAGQLIFLGPNGTYTTTSPVAPNHGVRLGEVLRVHQNQGSLYIRIDNGIELNEAHDVTYNGITSGDLLVRSGSLWINGKGLNGDYSLTGSLTTSGSQTIIGNQVVSGSMTIVNNLTVLGTSSFVNVTSSQLAVSESFISVNVFEPLERFGGLKVYDSGSSAATASLAWDSQNNRWLYQNASGSSYSSAMLISGKRNTGSLGDEQTIPYGRIVMSVGGDHIDESSIYQTGSIIRVERDTQITGSLTVTGGINGTLDYSLIANTPTLVSGSSQINITGTTGYSTVSSSIATALDGYWIVTDGVTDENISKNDTLRFEGSGLTTVTLDGPTDNRFIRITSPTNISSFTNDSGYITAHPSVTAATSSNNSGRTYIQDILLDSFGHITGITTATETVVDTNYYVTGGTFNTTNGNVTLTRNDGTTVTVNLDGRYLTAHPSVTAATSSNNSGRTYIQDILLDSFGHITGITTATETVVDTNDYISNIQLVGNSLEFTAVGSAFGGQVDLASINTDTNYFVTGATFNNSTGVITLTRNDGNTVTVDIDGRFSLTDYYTTGATTNNTNGLITFTRNDGNTYTTSISGYVQTQIANLIDSAPTTLDTLNELAAALGDDPNFATTISTSIGNKVSKSGDTMTGNLTAPKFITSGGTSSQFVKGDGTLDSSTYLTSHPSVTAASSSNNSGRTYVQDILLDSYGHITGITTATETVVDTDTITRVGTAGLEVSGVVTLEGSGATSVTQNGSVITIDTSAGANTYVTGATFNTSTGVISLTRNDGNTVTVDIDGRFSTTDYYVTGATFNSTTGVITLTRNDGNTVTVDIDGKYAEASHTHTEYVPTGRTITINGTSYDLSTNRSWTVADTNYYVTGATFNTGTGVITLTRSDGGTVTVDIDGKYAESSHTHDDRYYTETEVSNFFGGVTSITGYNKTNWDTAYGWGNHALGGYLTAHPSVTAASSSNNSGRTYIQDILLDSFGHITGITTATETVVDTNYYISNIQLVGNSLEITGVGSAFNGQIDLASINTDTNYFVTGATFNTGTGVITLTRNDGNTVTVDIDGKYAELSHTHTEYVPTGRTLTINGTSYDLSSNRSWTITDTNNYVTGATFNTGTGVITLTRNDGGTVSVDIDGKYAESSHTQAWSTITSTPTTISGYGITDAVPTGRTITINGTSYDLSTNRTWTTTDYYVTGATFNTSTGVITLTRNDGNTVTVDIDGKYAESSHTHDDRYYTETEIASFFSGGTSISGYNKTNWDTAYGWGNHASAGYQSASTAITTSNIGSQSVNYATYAGYLDSFDTRASITTPESYSGKRIRFDFKQNTTNGLSDGGTYNGVMYWRKYGSTTDWSGGGAMEIAYTDNGNLWHRYGTSTTWGSWRRVWNGNDFSSTNITNWNSAYGWGNHASAGYATEGYVQTEISNLIDGASDALNTLNELATALGNDPNFATTISTSIGNKVAKSGDTMTGNLAFNTSGLGVTWSMNTDGAFIKFVSTSDATGASYLEIGTNDNADEEIKFTQASNVRAYIATDGFFKNGAGYKYVYENGTWGINISGNASTVSNGVYTTGSYSNPTWITGLAWSKISSTPTTISGYGITDAVPTGRTITINGTAYDLSTNRTWTTPDTNYYVTGATFSTGTGVITLTRNDGGTVTVDIDGKYAESSHTHTEYVPTGRTITINGTAYDLSANRSWSISDTNNYVTGATFNTSTGVITMTRNDGGTVTVDIDGKYAESSHTQAWSTITSTPTTISGYGITDAVSTSRTLTINGTSYDLSANRSWTISDTNYYVTGATFSTSTGVITLTRNDGGTVTVDIDGKYAESSHTQAWSTITSTPTTISGYGITDGVATGGSYSNPSWITSLAWSKITGAPAFITSYTETDTLATVTARGASTSTAMTVGDLYSNAWFRNNDANEGLYNQTSTMHLSSGTNGYWDMSSTTTISAIRFYTGGHLSALRGYVYANNSNEIGFLNASGSWSLRCDNSQNVYVTTALYAPIFYDSNDSAYYVNPNGTSNIKTLKLNSTTSGTEVFTVDGVNGRLFTITDDMSDSVFSVNTISGLPVIEAFSDYKVVMGRYGQNDFVISSTGAVTIRGNTVWHAGNDGSGSGLDADLVDGLNVHTDRNNEANKIVRTDSSGYIQAGWINTTSGDNGTTAIDRVYASSDGYLRYYSPTNFRTVLDVPTRGGSGASGTWGISVTGSAGSVAWTNVTGRPTAVSSFTNDSGYITNTNTYYYVSAGAGYGLGYWNSAPTTYGITMGTTSNYGAINDNSEYYLYLSMLNGTGRGIAFRSDNGITFQVRGEGHLFNRGPIYPGYNGGSYGGQASYYLYGDTGNSGLRTNGHFLINDNIYWGNKGVWLSSWLNQALLTSSSPTFNNMTITGELTETSSIRYKENVEQITNALDTVMSLRGVTYNKKENVDKEIGVIAEEIAEILPEVVKFNTEGEANSVSYSRITAILIEAIKDLKKEIDELKGNK